MSTKSLLLSVLLTIGLSGGVTALPGQAGPAQVPSTDPQGAATANITNAFQAFEQRFHEQPGCRGAQVSFWLAEREASLNQRPVFAVQEGRNMVPASTLKVVTAASFVEHFSDSQTVATRLLFDGQERLILQGGGDPELTSLQLSQMAKARLPGKIKTLWVDSRLFAQASYPPGWSWDDLEDSFAPEVRALLIDHGLATLPGAPWLSKKLYPLLLLNEPPAQADTVNLRNSDLAAGYALQWALRQNGVEVGEVLRIPAAQEAGKFSEVARVTSRPLYEVLRRGLAVSDNLVMECLHRLCREERPKDLQGDKEIRIVDGSGLSRYNLVTAKVLGEVVWNHPTLHLLFPTPGGEGTLSKRFIKTPLQDHLWAKTGTMSGVSGLAGEFAVNDKVYVFAMLTNGSVGPARPIKQAEDEWLNTIYGLLAPPTLPKRPE